MTTLEYLRSFRIGEYAIFDFAVSFIGIALLAPLLTKLFLKIRIDIPLYSWLAFTIPLSIVVHLLFGKMTPFTANVINIHDHYLLKIIVLALLVVGIFGIKIIAKK